MKLLIVEDEISMQKALCKGFDKIGYTVDAASDGEEAVELFYSNLYALVVLDLNLPKLDGMEVLKQIREESKKVPIIILSARSTVDDKVAGLDDGANDYLAKPFQFKELEARVRALLRRNFKTSNTVVEIEDVKLDTATRSFFVAGDEISLTRKEYAIIEYLILRRGEAISPSSLIEHIWESDSEDVFNSLKVHLSTLRKKLPADFIKNKRGQGYYVE